MTRLRRVALFASLSLGIGATPWLVFAGPSVAAPQASGSARPQATSSVGPKYDPDNVTAMSRAVEALLAGQALYIKKDFAGATDAFRKGIQLGPRNPLGHYLLAEALLASGNAQEAQAALSQAEELSDDRNPELRGRILFLQAEFAERERSMDASVTKWTSYAEYAAKHTDAGTHPGTAAARLAAIDKLLKLEKATEGVRARIAAEKDAGTDTGPAPKKK
jgi:tetratricopeptide (TPR) repeat protein